MTRRYLYAILICAAFLTLVVPEGPYRRGADIALICVALGSVAGILRELGKDWKRAKAMRRVMEA